MTSTAYNAAGWVDTTTDPRGIVTQRLATTTWAARPRPSQDYTDGTPTHSTNQTTEYTYDGDGHTLTVPADLPSSAYADDPVRLRRDHAGGSAVNSNDMLAAIEYPDPTTGEASTSASPRRRYTVQRPGPRPSR